MAVTLSRSVVTPYPEPVTLLLSGDAVLGVDFDLEVPTNGALLIESKNQVVVQIPGGLPSIAFDFRVRLTPLTPKSITVEVITPIVGANYTVSLTTS